jgi:hypothetical protein
VPGRDEPVRRIPDPRPRATRRASSSCGRRASPTPSPRASCRSSATSPRSGVRQ